MKPITPSGTRTREISSPFGRRQVSTTLPTGSGSAAICRRPVAISSMRLSVSVSRSRNARGWPSARARSTSARLASVSAAAFSSRARAICASASFLTRVVQSASARAPSRAARARASTSCLGSIVVSPPVVIARSQDHEVVPVNHFVHAPVAQPLLDLPGLRAADLAELAGVEVHEPAAQLATVPLADDRHHLAGREVALHLDDARRKQAPSLVAQGPQRPRVDG